MEKTITIRLTDDRDLMRNEGLGDYWSDNKGNVNITAYMKDEKSYNEAFLIVCHELIEQRLTEHRGIKEEDIDKFDYMVLHTRPEANEPGDEPDAPYYCEHRFAENIERLIAAELGIDFNDYFKNYV